MLALGLRLRLELAAAFWLGLKNGPELEKFVISDGINCLQRD